MRGQNLGLDIIILKLIVVFWNIGSGSSFEPHFQSSLDEEPQYMFYEGKKK